MSSVFGRVFRISTFGESHGKGLGVCVDGCPSGVMISQEDIQKQLDRRKPGQSSITTPRKEEDRVEILSGVYEGQTLGTSIGMIIYNQDQQSKAYNHMQDLYRPGHADYTYEARYGVRDWRGGGRASNRETAMRVAAGALASCFAKQLCNLEVLAWVSQVGNITSDIDITKVTIEQVESNSIRCPDELVAKKMIEKIEQIKKQGDSLGGKITFCIRNVPAGLGEPVFDKLTADIGKALLSIPAVKGIVFGMGDESIYKTGFENNDLFYKNKKDSKTLKLKTNRSGGLLGGISVGEPIYGTLYFKPTATIAKEQETISTSGETESFKGTGRHDPCVLPRAVPIVEAMLSLVMAEHLLLLPLASMKRLKLAFK